MRLIDADALGVGRCSRNLLPADYCAGWNGMVRLLEKAPTVDAVEVVRCNDCKHYKPDEYEFGCGCDGGLPYVKADDFCSCGERRDYD